VTEEYETQDMAFASFLVMNGASISQLGRKGRRVSWLFDLTPERIAELEAAWPSSEVARFHSTYQMLKSQLRK